MGKPKRAVEVLIEGVELAPPTVAVVRFGGGFIMMCLFSSARVSGGNRGGIPFPTKDLGGTVGGVRGSTSAMPTFLPWGVGVALASSRET